MSKKADLSVFDKMFADFGVKRSNQLLHEVFSGDFYGELFESLGGGWKENKIKGYEILSSYGYEHIEGDDGGGEGGGEYCYGVIKFQDKYFKAEWSYYSYNGCDYDFIEDTIAKVTPKTKTITVYE